MNNKNMRSGVVLLVVLFVSMVVAIISLGVLARGSRQMACGDAVAQRLKLDYLAEAGLVHAKTLLLNPQEVDTLPDPNGFWPGASTLQIQGGDDYYDLAVTQSTSGLTYRCTYNIQSRAYRQEGGERTLQSTLYAQLRLDPCIAYWAGGDTTEPNTLTINGDVYCNGTMTSLGMVNGDVFANGFIGAKTGQLYPLDVYLLDDKAVKFPNIGTDYFSPTYDSGELSGTPITPFASEDCNNLPAYEPAPGNPAGVVYRQGNLRLIGDVTIEGTLVVNGNLTIRGPGSTVIVPLKNFPAVVVNGMLTIENGAAVNIKGLVQANAMTVAADAGNVEIIGALFLEDSGINGDITITTAPMISSVNLISASSTVIKWSPAGGAFFKYIRRKPTP